ncbi:hydroxymethylbilane synthase [Panacagrimonas perspica]|uniref:Porphobilinogen deaminase n=1 Tax=Panacagrimonas perspica TaxID=381431 RepID=A0A4R7P4Q7_9GAMM|nr:hydroxymethylbilane synthase [Panacagrimonas perspica]TDU28774.1 hydroxymethylbilane synthase [Panacagrimonas perspica]THD02388.1 hydroxymethylbilane synthase [Panacagrimonas perspica]
MLRIATRESPLALWQAEHVRARLQAAHPDLEVTLVPMTTRGDQLLSTSLSTAGGKGLFVKELEQAMLEDRADLAVHSMKDVPAHQPEGLTLVAFLEGEDPRDAFVSNRHAQLADLPQGARVGTASLRRQSLLAALRPDLQIGMLRGNVGTRLRKLDENEFDAILLACAGLRRLGLGDRIREALDVQRFVPAIGQGVIGIEARADDTRTRDLLAVLHDTTSATRLAAERALNERLGGACTVPVAGHATVSSDRIRLCAMVGAPDGSRVVRDEISGAAAEGASLGTQLAERLLANGAREILGSLGIKA